MPKHLTSERGEPVGLRKQLLALLAKAFFALMQALALENAFLFQDRPGIIELQSRELGLGGEMQGQDISLLGNGLPVAVQRTGAV